MTEVGGGQTKERVPFILCLFFFIIDSKTRCFSWLIFVHFLSKMRFFFAPPHPHLFLSRMAVANNNHSNTSCSWFGLTVFYGII